MSTDSKPRDVLLSGRGGSRNLAIRKRLGASLAILGLLVYLLGAELRGFTGISPLYSGCGLMFSASSYADTVGLTFTSDRNMMPDPGFMRECLDDAVSQLEDYLKSRSRGRLAGLKKITGGNARGRGKSPGTDRKAKKSGKKPLAAKVAPPTAEPQQRVRAGSR